MKRWGEKGIAVMALVIFLGCGVFWTLRVITHPPALAIGYLYVTPFFLYVAKGLYVNFRNLGGTQVHAVTTDTTLLLLTVIASDEPLDTRVFGLYSLIIAIFLALTFLFDRIIADNRRRADNPNPSL